MAVTLLNAPARPLLTSRALALLAAALLVAFALARLIHPAPDSPVANRPAFTRRLAALPAIVVTTPEPPHARESNDNPVH